MLWNPESMNGVTYRSECDTALPIVIGPGRNGLRSVIFIIQTVNVVGFGQNIFRIFVVRNEMLLVIDNEIFKARGNRMILVFDVDLKWTQRGMTDIGSAHYLA